MINFMEIGKAQSQVRLPGEVIIFFVACSFNLVTLIFLFRLKFCNGQFHLGKIA